jgi:environmental stress-induced protein Ves
MTWHLVSLDAVTPQPWRNAGGVTRELLAWPGPANWRVRISVADVQAAGAFSRFEDVDRWFAVLEGDGVVLHLDGDVHRLAVSDAPFHFHGDAAVHCALVGGPTRDLNLMAPPGRGRMERVHARLGVHAAAGSLLAVYAHGKPAHVAFHGKTFDVPPRHLAWTVLAADASGTITGSEALWMEAVP